MWVVPSDDDADAADALGETRRCRGEEEDDEEEPDKADIIAFVVSSANN